MSLRENMSDVLSTVNYKINGTPKRSLLAHFEATFYFSRSEFTCHNIITINYYMQVNSLRLKLNLASKWASKHLWGYHLFCC